MGYFCDQKLGFKISCHCPFNEQCSVRAIITYKNFNRKKPNSCEFIICIFVYKMREQNKYIIGIGLTASVYNK